MLRKFFRSKAGMVSVDMVEALMGHSGYLTDVYRKYPNSEETLAEFYKQVEPSLEIFGRIGEQFTKLKEETTGLQTTVDRLVVENISLRQRLLELESSLEKKSEQYDKAIEWLVLNLNRAQRDYLKGLGHSQEQVEEIMKGYDEESYALISRQYLKRKK